MKKFILKVLSLNRKVIKRLSPTFFMIACVVMVVLGAGIFIDKPIQIVMTDKPIWLGYFLVYGGLFLMIMCVVNEVVGIFKYRKILGLFQSIKNKNSLKTRIEKEGQESDIKTS